jgi:MFS family permease
VKQKVASSPTAGLGAARSTTSRYAARAFGVLFAIGLLNYLDRSILVGAANVVAHELGLGLDSLGFIASAFLIVYTLGTIPMGIWADRAMRKNVVAVSVVIWSIATTLTTFAFDFLSLFASRMVLGIGEAGYLPAGTAMLSDYFPRERRSRIMSWWSVSSLIGIFLGVVIGGIVAGLYVGSWRLAFLFTGIPGVVLAVLAWRLREPRRNEADEAELLTRAATSAIPASASVGAIPTRGARGNVLRQVRSLIRIKTLVVLTVMQMFALFVTSVAVVYLPTYLQQTDVFGLSSGAAGAISGAVIAVAGAVGTIGGGYLADLLTRFSAGARVLVCGIGFLLSAPAFVLSLTTRNFPIFALFFLLTTIFITLYSGPSTAATVDVVPAALRASAVAVTLLVAFALGEAFSPALVGALASYFDPTGGSQFAQNLAGHDLALAMLVTCTPALVIAGLVGVIGARWMKNDVVRAQEADRLASQASLEASQIEAGMRSDH